MTRLISDVEECRILMNSARVKPILDRIVVWYEQEQKRQRETQFVPVQSVEAV